MEEDARRVKPRRAHQKSRNGCSQCKSRKIKCDETKPTCSKCKHYGTTCSYLQTQPLRALTNTAIPKDTNHSPTAIPSPPTQTSISSPSYPLSNPSPSNSTTFTMLDLELLHSWTTHIAEKSFAAQILNNNRRVYLMKTTFVELAFDCPFLMHEILSLSALYLASTSPANATRYHMASGMHHDQALSLYQATLPSLSQENCHACFACSTLLSIHICASWSLQSNTISNPFSESAHIQWMKMHIGHKALVSVVWEDIRDGPLSPLFKPWLGLSDTDATPLPPAEKLQIDLLCEAWVSSTLPESDIKVLNKTLQTLRRMISIGSTNHAISRETATLAWITQISEEYVKLVETRVPEAMLILATYCVLLKRIAYLWWCRGIAEKLLTIAMEVLDAPEEEGKWERWVRWPTEQVFGPQFPKAGEEQWENTTKCPGCIATGANCTHL